MNIDPEQSVCNLAVVIKGAIVSEELAISGSVTVWDVD